MSTPAEDTQRLVRALGAVADLVQRRARAHPEDVATVRLLGLLRETPGQRPSALAEQLGLPRSALTPRVRALVEADEVVLSTDPDDARAYVLALTPAGQDHLDRVAADLGAWVGAALEGWSPDDVARLADGLERLLATARDRLDDPQRRRRWWTPPD